MINRRRKCTCYLFTFLLGAGVAEARSFSALGQDPPTPISEISVGCWTQTLEIDGRLSCQNLMVTAKDLTETYVFPELAARDAGGALTQDQANQACEKMGFGEATEIKLSQSAVANEFYLVEFFDHGDRGQIFRDDFSYIQNLVCSPLPAIPTSF